MIRSADPLDASLVDERRHLEHDDPRPGGCLGVLLAALTSALLAAVVVACLVAL